MISRVSLLLTQYSKTAARTTTYFRNSEAYSMSERISKFCTDIKDQNNGSKPNKTEQAGIPEDFFDENVENEKEFLDIVSALGKPGGLENLTTIQEKMSWEKIEKDSSGVTTFVKDFKEYSKLLENENEGHLNSTHDDYRDVFTEFTKSEAVITRSLLTEDLSKHLDEIENAAYIPEAMLNYTVPWETKETPQDPLVDKFVPKTSPSKFRFDKQGDRHCSGGMQRKGKEGILRCHKIDMDDFHFMDVMTIRKYLSEDGEILGKKVTGLCSRCQRKVSKTIKRARHMGIVPHIGNYFIQDSRPLKQKDHLHDAIAGSHVVSNTIL